MKNKKMTEELSKKISEAKEELSYLNDYIIKNLRESGYSAESKDMRLNWGIIRIAYRSTTFLTDLKKRELKYESFFSLVGNSVVLNESKLINSFLDQQHNGQSRQKTSSEEVPKSRSYINNGKRVIERIIVKD